MVDRQDRRVKIRAELTLNRFIPFSRSFVASMDSLNLIASVSYIT